MADLTVTTFVCELPELFQPSVDGATPEETEGWGWFSRKQVGKLPLHPAFEELWDSVDWKSVGELPAAKTASWQISKVGPHGYIHGWIKVGVDTAQIPLAARVSKLSETAIKRRAYPYDRDLQQARNALLNHDYSKAATALDTAASNVDARTLKHTDTLNDLAAEARSHADISDPQNENLSILAGNQDASELKAATVQRLADETGIDSDRVNRIIKAWATPQSDPAVYHAIQRAVSDEFNLDAPVPDSFIGGGGSFYAREIAPIGNKFYAENGDEIRKVVRGQYDLTQQDLASAGITQARLFRGLSFDSARDVPSWLKGPDGSILPAGSEADLNMRPVESWTPDAGDASLFTSGSQRGVMIESDVPADRILSTPKSGFGSLGENEYTVLATSGQTRLVHVKQPVKKVKSVAGLPVTKHFDPGELRDEHGEWSRIGSEALAAIKPLTDSEKRIDTGDGYHTDLELEGVDPELQHEVADRVKAFAEKYPYAAQLLTKVSASTLSSTTMAQTHLAASGESEITLNLKHYGDKAVFTQKLQNMEKIGFHPLSSTQSVIDHELGHVIDNSHFDGAASSLPSSTGSWSMGYTKAPARIGGYAATSPREAFAEGFSIMSDQQSSDPAPAEIAAKLSAAMKTSLENLQQWDKRQSGKVAQNQDLSIFQPTCEGYVPESLAKAHRIVDLNGQETWVQDSPDDLSYPAAGGGARSAPDAPNLGELSPGGVIPPSAGAEPPRWQPGENLVAWSEPTSGAGRSGANPWSGGTLGSVGDGSSGTHASSPEGGNDAAQGGGRGSSPPYSGFLSGPDTGGKWPEGGEGTEQAPVSMPGGATGVAPSSSAVIKDEGGPEGYIHGWICVRPPCGDKPKRLDAADLSLVKDDGSKVRVIEDYSGIHVTGIDDLKDDSVIRVIHEKSGWEVGNVRKNPNPPNIFSKWITTHAIDGHESSAMVSEAARFIAAFYNRQQPSSAPLHGWISTARIGSSDIGMTDSRARGIARSLSDGGSLGSDELSKSVKNGIASWSDGDNDKTTPNPLDFARFKLVVHNAQPSSKKLYRGTDDSALIDQLKNAHPGDIVKTDRAVSWSDDENVAREFVATGVMLHAQSGIRGVSIKRYADPEYKDQNEWVSPPSSYQVVSNEIDLDTGLRILNVKEVPS